MINGSQWIARDSSYIDIEHIDLRSAFISHTRDEHKDYQMLDLIYYLLFALIAIVAAASAIF